MLCKYSIARWYGDISFKDADISSVCNVVYYSLPL